MNSSDSLRRLQCLTAMSALALVLATCQLWTPQTVFPQVPVFEIFCSAPAWLDWICLVILSLGLVMIAFSRSSSLSHCGCMFVLVSLLTLVFLDQHRFQPWAYQLWLFVATWLCFSIRSQIASMRWLMISIYFYSAMGKCDYEFFHSVGQQMLGAMFKLIGQHAAIMPDWLRLGLVCMFPMTELAIAIGLAWPKSRRVAGFLAIGLHLTLILVLGPLGLNHRLGVLIWNAQFAMQAAFLFVSKRLSRVNDAPQEQIDMPQRKNWLRSSPQTFGMLLIAIAIVMPLTERFGIWDHWPSWALYAPHSSRVRVEVTGPSLKRLPEELVALTNKPASETEEGFDWVMIPIDEWSLQTLDTPIYPQSRFQLGVARQIAAQVNSEDQVRVTLLGIASRFTGVRQSEVIQSDAELAKSVKHYWLNARPRMLMQHHKSL